MTEWQIKARDCWHRLKRWWKGDLHCGSCAVLEAFELQAERWRTIRFMTKREAEFLNRLHDRRLILERKMERLTPEFVAYADVKKELNALKWAIGFIEEHAERV